jgi:uncharacterized membrane protein YccF (DUF307 family)
MKWFALMMIAMVLIVAIAAFGIVAIIPYFLYSSFIAILELLPIKRRVVKKPEKKKENNLIYNSFEILKEIKENGK